MDILDASGKVVRSFSSEKDKNYKPHNGGGPRPAPTLSKKEGLNRFVWDMKTPILPGVPGAYIESRFSGHVVPPGTYFPNKFTAEYLFLIDATNSTIPRVNQPSKDRKAELDAQWSTLKARANSLINTTIPDFNKKLWNAGIGAIRL